jgi:hypothetical protein
VIQPTNQGTSPPWEGDDEFTTFEIGLRPTEHLSGSMVVGYVIVSDFWVNEKKYELHVKPPGNSGYQGAERPVTSGFLSLRERLPSPFVQAALRARAGNR